MAQFITRIELHDNATGSDYEILHASMGRQGFLRTIYANDGHYYHMLTAEYNLIAAITAEDVLALAKTAAATTSKRYSVFVTEMARCIWYNLALVK